MSLRYLKRAAQIYNGVSIKPGGLDWSRRGLDRDSRSRRRQRVSLDSRENLDSVKKLVSTEKSRF